MESAIQRLHTSDSTTIYEEVNWNIVIGHNGGEYCSTSPKTNDPIDKEIDQQVVSEEFMFDKDLT